MNNSHSPLNEKQKNSNKDYSCNGFIGYSSIENHYDKSHIDKIRKHYENVEFIAMEKIHGANFQFVCYYDENNFVCKCARRTAYIKDTENFYNWNGVLIKYRDILESLYQDIYKNCNAGKISKRNTFVVRIFGELCGGYYTDIKSNDEKTVAIQRAIQYSPNNEVIVFDIMIYDELNKLNFTMKYTDLQKYIANYLQ